MEKKALLFINGEPPQSIPSLEEYHLVACTDGAYFYLPGLKVNPSDLDFISGDFDSRPIDSQSEFFDKHIYTPDQEHTDFYKALEILQGRDVVKVDVYGGSGGEMDHFLGNLSVAYQFKEKLEIRFFDSYSTYCFIPPFYEVEVDKGQLVSLYPFPEAHGIQTTGLHWELKKESLSILGRIGTRNFAEESKISIEYSTGDLLLFLGNEYGNQPKI
ncbi:thiamine diphosphokinase [Chryseobacterium sp. A321]